MCVCVRETRGAQKDCTTYETGIDIIAVSERARERGRDRQADR